MLSNLITKDIFVISKKTKKNNKYYTDILKPYRTRINLFENLFEKAIIYYQINNLFMFHGYTDFLVNGKVGYTQGFTKQYLHYSYPKCTIN